MASSRELLKSTKERIDEIELAGPVSRLQSSLVGGVKHLPVRFAR